MDSKTEVLYNGECPICSREVKQYERLSRKQALPITYDDLSGEGTLARWGITPEQAAKRFHVRKEGVVTSGIPAFILLWRDIPQTKWLARFVNLPGVHWIACAVYDYALAPLLYRMHVARQRRAQSASR